MLPQKNLGVLTVAIIGVLAVVILSATFFFNSKSKEDDRNIRRPRTVAAKVQQVEVEVQADNEGRKTFRGSWEPLYTSPNGWLFLYKLDGKEYLINNQGAIVEHVKAK